MDRIYQVVAAVLSCLFGILFGFCIIRKALKTTRRTSDVDQTQYDDVSMDSFQNAHSDNQKLGSSRGMNDRYTSLPDRHVESMTMDRLDTHRRLPENNAEQVYHTLSACNKSRPGEVEPPADYPVTPMISRQVSVPVPIPHVDYSDEETLEDYPASQGLAPNKTDNLSPTRPYAVKRSTSYPLMNRDESERGHMTGYSKFHAGRIQPITERVIDSHTLKGYSVTNQQSDHHVIINIYNPRQKTIPDSTRSHQEKNQCTSTPYVPRPDYY